MRHAGGIRFRHVSLVDRRPVSRRQVPCVDDVLEAHGDTVKRSRYGTRVEHSRLIEGMFGIDHDPRGDIGIARLDPVEAGAHQRFAGDLPFADLPCGVSRG